LITAARPENPDKESLVGCFVTSLEAAWAYSDAHEKHFGAASTRPPLEEPEEPEPAVTSRAVAGAATPLEEAKAEEDGVAVVVPTAAAAAARGETGSGGASSAAVGESSPRLAADPLILPAPAPSGGATVGDGEDMYDDESPHASPANAASPPQQQAPLPGRQTPLRAAKTHTPTAVASGGRSAPARTPQQSRVSPRVRVMTPDVQPAQANKEKKVPRELRGLTQNHLTPATTDNRANSGMPPTTPGSAPGPGTRGGQTPRGASPGGGNKPLSSAKKRKASARRPPKPPAAIKKIVKRLTSKSSNHDFQVEREDGSKAEMSSTDLPRATEPSEWAELLVAFEADERKKEEEMATTVESLLEQKKSWGRQFLANHSIEVLKSLCSRLDLVAKSQREDLLRALVAYKASEFPQPEYEESEDDNDTQWKAGDRVDEFFLAEQQAAAMAESGGDSEGEAPSEDEVLLMHMKPQAEIGVMNGKDLKELCELLGLSKSGSKGEKMTRLQQHQKASKLLHSDWKEYAVPKRKAKQVEEQEEEEEEEEEAEEAGEAAAGPSSQPMQVDDEEGDEEEEDEEDPADYEEVAIERILYKRKVGTVVEYLVKYEGYGIEHAEFRPAHHLADPLLDEVNPAVTEFESEWKTKEGRTRFEDRLNFNACWVDAAGREVGGTGKRPQKGKKWVGVSHAGFKKQNDVFLVGDSVAILLEKKTKRKTNLARILRLYEDDAAKWAEVLWYRHPRQTSYGEGYPYHKEVANEDDEFFLTDSMERVELETIERKVEILSVHEYRRHRWKQEHVFEDDGLDDEEVYLARHFYSMEGRSIVDLEKGLGFYLEQEAMFAKDDKEDGRDFDYDDEEEERKKRQKRKQAQRKKHQRSSGDLPTEGDLSGFAAGPEDPDFALAMPFSHGARPALAGLTRHGQARAALQASAVPSALKCRDTQKAKVMSFLKDAVTRKTRSGCMYIAGMPGTGKTATVHECIAALREKASQGEIQRFSYVEINGMRVPTPLHAYSLLWRTLSGEQLAPTAALAALTAHFEERARETPSQQRQRPVCVVLADELDWLLLRNEKVVYMLMNWPSQVAGLVVLGVANTMDLTERLSKRVGSRMGMDTLTFKPYNHEELATILNDRGTAVSSVFDKPALGLAARKVALVTGDARRALEVCRRASELSEQKNGPEAQVSAAEVNAAHKELFGSIAVTVIKSCSTNEQLFIVALLLEKRHSKTPEVTLERTTGRFSDLLQLSAGKQGYSTGQLYGLVRRLHSIKLLRAEGTELGRFTLLGLNIDEEDIALALGEHDILKRFL